MMDNDRFDPSYAARPFDEIHETIVDAASRYPDLDPRVAETLELSRRLFHANPGEINHDWADMEPRVIRRLNHIYGVSLDVVGVPGQHIQVVDDVR